MSGSEENQPELADQFEAKLHWLNAAEMLPGRSYILKTANSTITATVTRLKYKVETKNNLRIASSTLRANLIILLLPFELRIGG